MKAILLLFLSLSILVTKTFAQDRIYKPFKLDLAIGVLAPTGTTYLDGRFSFSAEPKYNISDQFSLGLRLEISPYSNFAGTSEPYKINSVSSYLLTGDYYFNKSKSTRPFFGIGAGMYKQNFVTMSVPETEDKSGKPGLATRIGLELSRFRIAVEYNATFFEELKRMNYFNFKIGGYLWGSRVKK